MDTTPSTPIIAQLHCDGTNEADSDLLTRRAMTPEYAGVAVTTYSSTPTRVGRTLEYVVTAVAMDSRVQMLHIESVTAPTPAQSGATTKPVSNPFLSPYVSYDPKF